MTIRKMTLQDLELIKENLQVDFDDFWNYNIFANELQNKYSTYFCAIDEEERIVGFAGVWQSVDVMHITNIVVKKTERGRHIGNKLLEELINFSKNVPEVTEITLEVHEDNIIAQELYKKHNFKPVGLRKRYYENNKNAIILTLQFNDNQMKG